MYAELKKGTHETEIWRQNLGDFGAKIRKKWINFKQKIKLIFSYYKALHLAEIGFWRIKY